jgi:hypothetical protein
MLSVKLLSRPVPDPVFLKTSPKRTFSITENEHFGLNFTKTWSKNSGTGGRFVVFVAMLKNTAILKTNLIYVVGLAEPQGKGQHIVGSNI